MAERHIIVDKVGRLLEVVVDAERFTIRDHFMFDNNEITLDDRSHAAQICAILNTWLQNPGQKGET